MKKLLTLGTLAPLEMLKSPSVLLPVAVRRPSVEQSLKPYWKSRKRPHFSS